MKNNIILLFVISSFSLSSCQSQLKPIGEEIIDLENFSFNTKISELYPDEYKSEHYKNTYVMRGFNNHEIFIGIDSLFFYDNNGIEYIQGNTSSLDSLAFFGNHIFQKINTISSTEGEIKLINAISELVTKTDANDFLKLLNEKYGKPKELINDLDNEAILYQWDLSDKVIRFVSIFNNDLNELNEMMYKVGTKKTPNKKESRFNCNLFIVNPHYKADIIKQKYFSNDLSFFREAEK